MTILFLNLIYLVKMTTKEREVKVPKNLTTWFMDDPKQIFFPEEVNYFFLRFKNITTEFFSFYASFIVRNVKKIKLKYIIPGINIASGFQRCKIYAFQRFFMRLK